MMIMSNNLVMILKFYFIPFSIVFIGYLSQFLSSLEILIQSLKVSIKIVFECLVLNETNETYINYSERIFLKQTTQNDL